MNKDFWAVRGEIFKSSRQVSAFLILKGKKQNVVGRIITRNEPEKLKTTVAVEFFYNSNICATTTVRGARSNREDEAFDEIFRELKLELTRTFRIKPTNSPIHGLSEWKQAFQKAGFTFLQAL